VRFSDEEIANVFESGRVVDDFIRTTSHRVPLDITFGEAWDDPACQKLTLAEFKTFYGDPRGQLVGAGLIAVRREGEREPRGVRRYVPRPK